jgi:hypothetical protein
VLFLLLVALNLGFYAWSAYYSAADATSDPRPLAQQIDPEKLRILRGGEAPPAAPPAPPPVPAAAEKPKPGPEPVPVVSCIEWGGFALLEAPRAETALEPLALGARLSQRRSEETAGWWVYLPQQPNRETALKKAGELKKLGVDDYFVVQEAGRWRWAVSLGVFSTEEAAKNRLEALRAKGVRNAQLGARELQVQKVWLQVRGADAAQQARLKEIATGFEGTELRACP